MSIAVLVVALGVAPSALAAPGHVLGGSFGSPGSLPGEFSTPTGIAVSQTSHDVLVADQSNGRVQRFAADGTFISSFDGSGTPSGSMSPSAIAVEESSGDIYVADAGSSVVNRFSSAGTYLSQLSTGLSPSGLAVDPTSGDVYISDFTAGGVRVFDSAGNQTSVISGAGTEGQIGAPGSVAVDGAGNVYVADGSFAGFAVVKRFSTGGSYVSTVYADGLGASLSVDPVSGELFIFELAGQPQILHYDDSGARQFVFGAGNIGFPSMSWPSAAGLAVDHDSGRIYVADQGANRIVYFDAVTLPDVITGPASGESTDGATLTGSVDPLGIDTSYHFVYGLTSQYGSSTPDASAGTGTGPIPVDAVLSGLEPNQTYHYRLIATNAFGENRGVDQTLTTVAAPPAVDAQAPFASNVRAVNARLNATVNPNNLPTTYHFEYGTTDGTFDSSTATASVGSGFGNVDVTQFIGGLTPDTTYYFRVVADNGTGGSVAGASGSFTTSSALPDVVIQPVTDVTRTSATLHAVVDTHGLAGTYRFSVEGVDNAFSNVTPEAAIGGGAGGQTISASVSDLRAGSSFRVRAIATTSAGAAQSAVTEFSTPAVPFPPAAEVVDDAHPYGCASPRLTGYRGKATPGKSITVLGSDLGFTGVLHFGSKIADTTSWTSTSIRVRVPANAKRRVQIRAACSNASNSIVVRVAASKPKLCEKGFVRKSVKRGNKRVSRCVKRPKQKTSAKHKRTT